MADQAQVNNNFLEKNKPVIFGGVLLIIAVAVFAFVVGGGSEKKNINAADEMFKAQAYFERDSFALALNGIQTPGAVSVDGFLQIIDKYSGTESANLAHYYAGVCLLNLGQYQDAINFLEKYKGGDLYTPAMALIALGDAKSELQDMAGAKAAYEKASKTNSNEATSPLALHKLAQLAEHEGNKDEAKSYLEQIQKSYSEYAEAALIEQDLIRITNTY